MKNSIFKELFKKILIVREPECIGLNSTFGKYELDVYMWEKDTDISIHFAGYYSMGRYHKIPLKPKQEIKLKNRILEEFQAIHLENEEKEEEEKEKLFCSSFNIDEKLHAESLIFKEN